ncbi:MAG: fructosamine kinase family protein [Cellulomonadaceae bacterium]
MVFRKQDENPRPGQFESEAAGLVWLRAAQTRGGARIVRILAVSATGIELETVGQTAPDARDAQALGVALARTHAAGAPHWGCPPPSAPHGPDGPLGYIGVLPLPLLDRPRYESWGAFYAHERLEPYLRRAVDRRAMPAAGTRAVEAVMARLDAGELDHVQPGLVTGPVARLHGDLWSGNVLWDGGPTGATLIDPAAHGGHAETDLAMLGLFGLARLEELLAAYDDVSRLAPGWQERVSLHQLHPLLVHAAIFGGGYGNQAAAAARQYA